MIVQMHDISTKVARVCCPLCQRTINIKIKIITYSDSFSFCIISYVHYYYQINKNSNTTLLRFTGYELVSPTTVRCTADLSWERESDILSTPCRKKRCYPPESIDNGGYRSSSDVLEFQTKIYYYCNPGEYRVANQDKMKTLIFSITCFLFHAK